MSALDRLTDRDVEHVVDHLKVIAGELCDAQRCWRRVSSTMRIPEVDPVLGHLQGAYDKVCQLRTEIVEAYPSVAEMGV